MVIIDTKFLIFITGCGKNSDCPWWATCNGNICRRNVYLIKQYFS